MSGERRTVRVRITGRVQGVWFRDWTRREALARGLDGWVRNRHDHSVEALFYGPGDDLEAMLEACRSGSPLAQVDEVRVKTEGTEPEPGFEIRDTL